VSGPSLLFVDDDAFACYGYTELLRIDGWAASSCDFGCAAASALVVSRPAMVVVHVWLPDSRGCATIREWSRVSSRGRPVVVALTASAAEAAARGAGCDAVILKPIEAMSFVGAIHELYGAFVGDPTDRAGRLRRIPPVEPLMADGGPVRVFRGVHQCVGAVQAVVHGGSRESHPRR
jgi:DNA-binding response OmpR family regulator